MEDDEEQVMSELHMGCSPHQSFCLSSFTIASSPPPGKHETFSADSSHPFGAGIESFMHEQPSDKHVAVDESGDLDIPRRKWKSRCMQDVETHKQTISIYHHAKTNIHHVGLQIWKASLILGDFILHKMQTTNELDDVIILELGAGTGILGILLAPKTRLVFLTGTLRIRQLDWLESWPPIATQIDAETSTDDQCLCQYLWLQSDMKELESVSIILASDVIYSDSLTDAFFCLLEKLMPSGSKKVLWLSLEKRYNFSLSELAVVAHCYRYFRSFLDDRTEDSLSPLATQLCGNQEARKSFAGKRIQLNQIPQYLLEYERTNDLELWEIWRT